MLVHSLPFAHYLKLVQFRPERKEMLINLVEPDTGGHTKKMLTSAVIWFGACIGNLAGPYFYKSNQVRLSALHPAAES